MKANIIFTSFILLASCANRANDNPNNDSTNAPKDSTAKEAVVTKSTDDNESSKDAVFEIVKGNADKSFVNVIVNGKKNGIDSISGEVKIYPPTEFAKYKIPNNALDTCGAWFGGQGKYYYILKTNKGLEIYEGYLDEEVPESEGYHWKKIKTL